MQLTLESLGEDLPAATESESYKHDLIVALIKVVKPLAANSTVKEWLDTCDMMEDPDGDANLLVNKESLYDVMPQGEWQDIDDWEIKQKVRRSTRHESVRLRHKVVDKAFPPAPAPKKKPMKAPRWMPKKDDRARAATAYIRSHMPPVGDVDLDEVVGRWRILYPRRKWRSISWTKRGFHVAVSEVLWQLWTWHYEATSEEPAWPIAGLVEGLDIDD